MSYPIPDTSLFGNVLEDKTVICGGVNLNPNPPFVYDNCRILGGDREIQMTTTRFKLSSVKLNQSTLWLIGGIEKHKSLHVLNSTEFVDLVNEKAIKGPDLEFGVGKHCSVMYNSTAIYVIGGLQSDHRGPS